MTIPFVYRIVEVATGRFYVGVKTAKNCEPSMLGRKNAARTYLFVSPAGIEYLVTGLREFLIKHSLPDRNTIVKFISTGVIEKPNQCGGSRRDNLTGWEIDYEI